MLDIIVVNWNTCDLLAKCLQSVQEESRASPSCTVETFVVDNASHDGSPQMVRERFPWVHLIENAENVGFARANNQAIPFCRGRYILLLNSDAVLPIGSLGELLRVAEEQPRAGIVGVKLINQDGSFQAALNDFPTPLHIFLEPWGTFQFLLGNRYYPSYPPERSNQATCCDWVGGACLLARAEAISQVGVLDEQFFMNSEEVDWCYRMRKNGWAVWYTPTVEVIHLGGGSSDRLSARQRMRLYTGKLRYLRKHYGRAAASLAYWNYRLSAGLKAAGYHLKFLFTKDEHEDQCASDYWAVAIAARWD